MRKFHKMKQFNIKDLPQLDSQYQVKKDVEVPS